MLRGVIPEGAGKRGAVTLALMAVMVGVATAPAHAAPIPRLCGLLPGDGAYSYIKTRGVTCRSGRKIANRARKRFCARHNRCRLGPPFPISKTYKGWTRYRGWRCHVKQGWELSVIRCQRGKQRIFEKAAA